MTSPTLFSWVAAKLVLAPLFLIALTTAASAQGWDLRFNQKQMITATLQTGTQGTSSKLCPAHFSLDQISGKIDLNRIGDITIKQQRPRIFSAGTYDRSRPAQQGTLSLQLELHGCTFRRNFLPLGGKIHLSGDLGIGKIEPTEFDYIPDGGVGDLNFQYLTRLSGTPSQFAKTPSKQADLQTMGQLTLYLPWTELPLASPQTPGQVVTLRTINLSIFIHPADAANTAQAAENR